MPPIRPRYRRRAHPVVTVTRCRRSAVTRVDFARLDRIALGRLSEILARWLPGGRIEAREYVALNPKRADRRPGSFKVNLSTGRWSDFAKGDAGGDLVSLVAYLTGLNQREAAIRLADSLGVDPFDGRLP